MKHSLMTRLILAGGLSVASFVFAAGQLDGINNLHFSHVHRGGGNERPDNTLETFMYCWTSGSSLECDCRKTRDGVGIMLHDETLKRTAKGVSPEMGKKKVSKELDWADIKDLDVGSYLKPEFAHHRIPSITQVFNAMKGHPTWLCMVDEKGAGPAYIAQEAIKAGVQDQVFYTGANYEALSDWQAALPGGKALIWVGAWPKDRSAAERARTDKHYRDMMAKFRANDFKYLNLISLHIYFDPKDPVDAFIPSSNVLKELIQEFHAHKIPVCSFTVKGGQTAENYYRQWNELGIDGFSTDYPSVVFKVIANLKRGQEHE